MVPSCNVLHRLEKSANMAFLSAILDSCVDSRLPLHLSHSHPRGASATPPPQNLYTPHHPKEHHPPVVPGTSHCHRSIARRAQAQTNRIKGLLSVSKAVRACRLLTIYYLDTMTSDYNFPSDLTFPEISHHQLYARAKMAEHLLKPHIILAERHS